MIRSACFLCLLLASTLSVAVAAPLEEADAAYTKGDYVTAVRLWRELAKQGNASAQFGLGRMYQTGRGGLPRDEVQAAAWFQKAAAQGNAKAEANLGILYEWGRGGLLQDDSQAVNWYRKAAEQGNADAEAGLGFMYEKGRGGLPHDDKQAVEWYRKAAEQAQVGAQANLGAMYERGGGGLPQDDKLAVEWYRRSAHLGNAFGQSRLGFMYQNGRGGLSRDDAQAVNWYRMAAEQGNAGAEVGLGFMYEMGLGGLPRDDKQAVTLYRKAAEQGNAYAQEKLGLMYYRGGGGLSQDDKQAVTWYRKAAEQGSANAQANLGFMYEKGRGGLLQDNERAVEWYSKAAEQGNATAQASLGKMYEQGLGGLPKDEKLAAEWQSKVTQQAGTNAQPAAPASEERETTFSDLSSTISGLVKANERTQIITPVSDAERARLAREVIEASGTHESSSSPEETKAKFAAMKKPANVTPRVWEAIGIALITSFQPDRIRALQERKLGTALDAATLEVGLKWERSDLAVRMRQLEREASRPEQRKAMQEFTHELVGKGGRTSDPRSRACAQADTLADRTDTVAPLLEAMTAGVMIGASQQAPALDTDAIRRAVIAVRPVLHEAAREGVLAQCLFAYKALSDAEINEWLEFLRSDSGGRYARGFNDSLRDALLDVTEVFTRTLIEVARQIKAQASS